MRRKHLILLTGFGPFGDIVDNPSGRLNAQVVRAMQQRGVSDGLQWKILDVRPGVIDEVKPANYRAVVATGVDAKAQTIRVETRARNLYIDRDLGKTFAIDSSLPTGYQRAGGPLPPGITQSIAGFSVQLGDGSSAGTYVCNDTFYRLCRSGTTAYFIHVPLIEPERDAEFAMALAAVALRLVEFLPVAQRCGLTL